MNNKIGSMFAMMPLANKAETHKRTIKPTKTATRCQKTMFRTNNTFFQFSMDMETQESLFPVFVKN